MSLSSPILAIILFTVAFYSILIPHSSASQSLDSPTSSTTTQYSIDNAPPTRITTTAFARSLHTDYATFNVRSFPLDDRDEYPIDSISFYTNYKESDSPRSSVLFSVRCFDGGSNTSDRYRVADTLVKQMSVRDCSNSNTSCDIEFIFQILHPEDLYFFDDDGNKIWVETTYRIEARNWSILKTGTFSWDPSRLPTIPPTLRTPSRTPPRLSGSPIFPPHIDYFPFYPRIHDNNYPSIALEPLPLYPYPSESVDPRKSHLTVNFSKIQQYPFRVNFNVLQQAAKGVKNEYFFELLQGGYEYTTSFHDPLSHRYNLNYPPTYPQHPLYEIHSQSATRTRAEQLLIESSDPFCLINTVIPIPATVHSSSLFSLQFDLWDDRRSFEFNREAPKMLSIQCFNFFVLTKYPTGFNTHLSSQTRLLQVMVYQAITFPEVETENAGTGVDQKRNETNPPVYVSNQLLFTNPFGAMGLAPDPATKITTQSSIPTSAATPTDSITESTTPLSAHNQDCSHSTRSELMQGGQVGSQIDIDELVIVNTDPNTENNTTTTNTTIHDDSSKLRWEDGLSPQSVKAQEGMRSYSQSIISPNNFQCTNQIGFNTDVFIRCVVNERGKLFREIQNMKIFLFNFLGPKAWPHVTSTSDDDTRLKEDGPPSYYENPTIVMRQLNPKYPHHTNDNWTSMTKANLTEERKLKFSYTVPILMEATCELVQFGDKFTNHEVLWSCKRADYVPGSLNPPQYAPYDPSSPVIIDIYAQRKTSVTNSMLDWVDEQFSPYPRFMLGFTATDTRQSTSNRVVLPSLLLPVSHRPEYTTTSDSTTQWVSGSGVEYPTPKDQLSWGYNLRSTQSVTPSTIYFSLDVIFSAVDSPSEYITHDTMYIFFPTRNFIFLTKTHPKCTVTSAGASDHTETEGFFAQFPDQISANYTEAILFDPVSSIYPPGITNPQIADVLVLKPREQRLAALQSTKVTCHVGITMNHVYHPPEDLYLHTDGFVSIAVRTFYNPTRVNKEEFHQNDDNQQSTRNSAFSNAFTPNTDSTRKTVDRTSDSADNQAHIYANADSKVYVVSQVTKPFTFVHTQPPHRSLSLLTVLMIVLVSVAGVMLLLTLLAFFYAPLRECMVSAIYWCFPSCIPIDRRAYGLNNMVLAPSASNSGRSSSSKSNFNSTNLSKDIEQKLLKRHQLLAKRLNTGTQNVTTMGSTSLDSISLDDVEGALKSAKNSVQGQELQSNTAESSHEGVIARIQEREAQLNMASSELEYTTSRRRRARLQQQIEHYSAQQAADQKLIQAMLSNSPEQPGNFQPLVTNLDGLGNVRKNRSLYQ